MLILVTNDDGYDAEGIQTLAKKLKLIPNAQVVIVAPLRERSAASHAITLHRPLRIEKISNQVFAVDGTPTDAVVLGVHKILKKKPNLLVSGINAGENLGEDVHYSGTVSAAVEGALMGIPSIAVSVVRNQKTFCFDGAAQFACKLAKLVIKNGLPKGVVLNVNVPNLDKKNIRDATATHLGSHNYGGIIVEKQDPRGKPYYWIGGEPNQLLGGEGTDTHAYLNRGISVTPLKVDMTDYHFLNELKNWKL